MKNKNLKEYQNDDINIYMNEDGHIIGKVDNLYVTTKNEDNKMLLEITGEAMPHKSNEYVKEDFEGVEISVLATFVSVRRTCMKLEIDDNGKFTVAIDSDGAATVIAQGSNTRKYMQYNNKSTSSPAFYCTDGSLGAVCLYKYYN